ncbi:hypothetical protein PIB30_032988 [Stylosanthes scabra]|uniref:Uncharacterized protein n=1 Tax=Stylosanthes scabra TaxID=79078 RepID=A0ABU6TC38_9FABA|nr:hypothetical protein [Stylosanthes scabra]
MLEMRDIVAEWRMRTRGNIRKKRTAPVGRGKVPPSLSQSREERGTRCGEQGRGKKKDVMLVVGDRDAAAVVVSKFLLRLRAVMPIAAAEVSNVVVEESEGRRSSVFH